MERFSISLADLDASTDRDAWDGFAARTRGVISYHQTGWLRIIAKTFGHKPHALWARDDAGQVLGVLPLVHMKSRIFGSFLVSIPFFNYGGVLADSPEVAEGLAARAVELRDELGADHVELRHVGKVMDGLPTKTHKVTMHLALPEDAEVLWKGFKAKVRNQVRKALKSDMVFSSGRHELLDDFYAVFARNMRDLGTPVYSKDLFKNVLDEFPDNARLFAVHHPDGCVAASVGIWYNGVFEVPWASSIREYNKFCPNNLLYWEMISHACGLGCSTFDFGRSTPDKGTFRFKKQWGAEPVQLHWQYLLRQGEELPEMNPDNPKFKLAISMWQKLPVPLTKLIGPSIVRNIP